MAAALAGGGAPSLHKLDFYSECSKVDDPADEEKIYGTFPSDGVHVFTAEDSECKDEGISPTNQIAAFQRQEVSHTV